MTANDRLEAGLTALLESLDTDLECLRETSPGVATVLVQTSVSVLVLEYLLHKKHILEREEMLEAVAEAQQAIRRFAGREADA